MAWLIHFGQLTTDDHATTPGLRVKRRPQPGRTETVDQAVDQGQVHPADDGRVLRGQLMERAASQVDGALLVLPGLETMLSQCGGQTLRMILEMRPWRPAAPPEVGAELMGGAVE